MARKEERRDLTILWRIENFSYSDHLLSKSGIHSSIFRPCSFNGSRCCLKLLTTDGNLSLLANGDAVRDKHLQLQFKMDGEALGYQVDCEWSLLGSDESPLVSRTVRNHLFLAKEPLVLPVGPTTKYVFDTRRSSFLPRDTLTVSCRIAKPFVQFAEAEHFSLLGRFVVREQSFVWPIDGFREFWLGDTVTKRVYLHSFPKTENLKLKFSSKGQSLLESVFGFEVQADTICEEDLTVEVSVLDNAQRTVRSGDEKFDVNRRGTCFALDFISRRVLLDQYTCGDVLNLLVVFKCLVSNHSTIESTYLGPSNPKRELGNDVVLLSEAGCQTALQGIDPPDISQGRGDALVTLGEDFLSLYRDHALSDFELRSGDVSFPVHKLVLSARSPVFRSMFSSDMKESESDSLEVPDVDTHSLNRMLTFLYAGAVDPLQWEAAANLYHAADKYQVQSLKLQCSSFLRSDIAVSNASDILTLADRHGDEELTSILSNYDEIMQSVEWESFIENDAYFAGKTMHQLFKKRLELKNPRGSVKLNARRES